jgi:hypothetical protein
MIILKHTATCNECIVKRNASANGCNMAGRTAAAGTDEQRCMHGSALQLGFYLLQHCIGPACRTAAKQQTGQHSIVFVIDTSCMSVAMQGVGPPCVTKSDQLLQMQPSTAAARLSAQHAQ